MKKILLVVLSTIVLLVAGIYGAAEFKYRSSLNVRKTGLNLALTIQPAPELAAEGRRILTTRGCVDCHGKDLAGMTFIEDPMVGTFSGPNLTRAAGGRGQKFQTADWVRAIRYGVAEDGSYLRFMPSNEFSALTDEDLARVISAITEIPAVERADRPLSVGPLAKVLYRFGQMPLLFPGEHVPEGLRTVSKLQPEATARYGQYVSASCVGCHNPKFSGGAIPGVPPEWPKAANLTPKGAVAKWSLDQFKQTLRTGKTPEGKTLDPKFMPWPATAAMNDVELESLYRFLKELAPADAI